jgi:adenine-specific DNA methylase
MSIENNYSIRFIAGLALREKQIQQNYRPIIGVHKWFARRPGALFRGLLLAEFGERPVEETYFRANDFEGVRVADPFMGGGTPLLEANRMGCDVIGADINPMAAWIVQEEIEAIELRAYLSEGERLVKRVAGAVGHLYQTRCPVTGRVDADVKYFLWVKTGVCRECGKEFDLFPGYVLAEDARHTSYVLVCPSCGDLNEVEDPRTPGMCGCGTALLMDGPVRKSKCGCPHCGHVNSHPFHGEGAPRHRLFAVEYYNPDLKDRPGRLFKKPDEDDLARVAQAERMWARTEARFVPEDEIPEGDETTRLHRWGYGRFRELFNARQLLGLETSARAIAAVEDARLRRALATNFSDLLRYQNMLCRYDTMALKSLDVFSIHGFPVGYVQVESNLLGIRNGNALPVGSGGWVNVVEKYARAKRYCIEPFEVTFEGRKKITVPVRGEWIGEKNPDRPAARQRRVEIRCAAGAGLGMEPRSLDGVFTDPPYYGMVQYGELMHFCYVWLRKLMGATFPGLEAATTRNADELTGNETAERGLEHFTEGLAAVYRNAARALKPGAPLVFTYHHNQVEAYAAVGVAILDSGLVCSASLPCPAEMGGSIHIHGTGSSIVDTVFVCRASGAVPRPWLFGDAEGLARLMSSELAELTAAGMKPTAGDIRCAALGHITRLAVWNLRARWDSMRATGEKLAAFRKAMDSVARVEDVAMRLDEAGPAELVMVGGLFGEAERIGDRADAVTF